ncbi:MAG: DUF362 domain-containing protein [Sedimentisphaerales bacterium]|nr:DUF362 domain-containing protein [Sedimentisphaerales bacterium]
MTKPIVTLTKCDDYSEDTVNECLQKHFELQGGLEKFISRGDTVLLKPNFLAPRPRNEAVQTDPAVIIGIARLLKDFGAKPFVGDSPAWGNVYTCAKALELEEPLKKLDVPIIQLNKPKNYSIGPKNTKVGISRVALKADAIINLPKFKSHQQLKATFAIKNMFGCVSGKRKALMHFIKGNSEYEFCEFLIDIYKLLNPVLTIIDAITVMDGSGPIHGRARPLGWLAGGSDPIAIETVCSKLINIEPETLPIIQTSKQLNFGCSDFNEIKILGDEFPENVCTDFRPAQLIPIKFSLPRICKSVSKQMSLTILRTLLIAKETISRKKI